MWKTYTLPLHKCVSVFLRWISRGGAPRSWAALIERQGNYTLTEKGMAHSHKQVADSVETWPFGLCSLCILSHSWSEPVVLKVWSWNPKGFPRPFRGPSWSIQFFIIIPRGYLPFLLPSSHECTSEFSRGYMMYDDIIGLNLREGIGFLFSLVRLEFFFMLMGYFNFLFIYWFLVSLTHFLEKFFSYWFTSALYI